MKFKCSTRQKTLDSLDLAGGKQSVVVSRKMSGFLETLGKAVSPKTKDKSCHFSRTTLQRGSGWLGAPALPSQI